jgi:gliding motility-associated-like protein
MIFRYFIILMILTCIRAGNLYSQTDCLTDPPLPPVLTSVSIDPVTGYTDFTWTPSPSPNIAAYILYSYKNGDGMPIDTIRDPAAVNYTLAGTASKYFSVAYVLTAMRLPRCTSIFSNVINSIFEEASIDTCMKKISVSWNSYPSVPVKVNSYSVLMSVNGSGYTISGTLSPETTNYVPDDFALNSEYCFVVRADLENGSNSTSNKSCLSTKMQRPPDWINADQATIDADGNIAVSFTIDPLSEITHFSLERKTGPAGQFQEISRPVSSNDRVGFTDNQAATDIINYYRLSAVNSCNLPVTVSNLASNIVLSLERSGPDIKFSWNPYKEWLGTISSYKLYVNTGGGFEEKAVIAASDSLYNLGYREIMNQVSSKEVCFYINASEISNPHGITGESRSSEACTSPTEIVTVPNVFTPNGDLKNDLFRPVLSFTPSAYQLIISDMKGNVLFETRDYLASWDGTKNGNPQPEGVFLWFLKLTTPSGKVISKTGTITIVNNK